MPEVVSLAQGALCISIDVEAMWGVWDHATLAEARLCAEREGPTIDRLLATFAKYDAPATWAIVGRLLDAEPGFDGLVGPRDAWYTPDVAEKVATDRVAHEVGSHSYAHVYYASIPEAEARDDLARVRSTHEARGLDCTSFVFPRNAIAHVEALSEAGIRVFRSVDQGILLRATELSSRLRAPVNLAEKAFGLPSPVVLPVVHEGGVVELPSSTLLIGRNGMRKVVLPQVMRHKLVAATRRASREQKIFHLWFHPSNFYHDPDTQFGLLEAALAEARDLRERGKLAIRTMGSFAGAA